MEYGLWNLPTGFWQTGNQGSLPMESMGRPAYYTPANVGVPVFHGSLNEGDLTHYAVTGSQSYRHQTEFLAAKNVTGGRSSIGAITDDKSQLEGVMTLPGDLLEPRSMESLSSESTQQPVASSPVLEDRQRIKLRRNSSSYEQLDDSNGTRPDVYMKPQSFQHPMYGMLLTQIAAGTQDARSEIDADEEFKGEPVEPLADGSESVPCRSPSSGDTSSRAGFECGECGLVADTRPALKKHIGMAHPDVNDAEGILQKIASVPTSCPMASCRFKTSERNELEAHMAVHVAEGFSTNGKKKACPIALQRVRYEREEYRCQLCAYSCTIEKAFYKHLKIHSMGIEPSPIKISCVICGKDRTSEVEMNKHMKKHRDDRYFCCDICIFKTVQLKKLIQHRRMHTGEKPHLCPHCSYRSARRDNLRSHVRRVHKKENLYCDTFSPRGLLLSASSTAPETSASPAPQE